MIYSFDFPHKVGTVCGLDCPVCVAAGPLIDNPYMTDQHGNMYPLQPVLILREATYQEAVEDLLADGGTSMPAAGKYYYEVSTD